MIHQLLLLLVVLIAGHPLSVTANTYLYDASTKHPSSNSFEFISQQSNYESKLTFYRPVDSFYTCCGDENIFSGTFFSFVSDFLVTKRTGNTVVRTTRAGDKAIRTTRPDGSVIDISPKRVKEFVPNTNLKAPPGALNRVKFDNAIPGSKGFKRPPTQQELDILKNAK